MRVELRFRYISIELPTSEKKKPWIGRFTKITINKWCNLLPEWLPLSRGGFDRKGWNPKSGLSRSTSNIADNTTRHSEVGSRPTFISTVYLNKYIQDGRPVAPLSDNLVDREDLM